MSICVLCPSRGNPKAALEAYLSMAQTASKPSTVFSVVVDADDPLLAEYVKAFEPYQHPVVMTVPAGVGGNMNKALNWAAVEVVEGGAFDDIGFIGDDHRFRTVGWDHTVGDALSRSAIVYGNDLFQGRNLPTQVFIRSEVVRALGWFGLPGCWHLYLDNAWKALGERLDSLEYLDEVVIEHMHPVVGKGVWDENHVRVNRPEVYEHDREVFEDWLINRSEADVAAVKAVLR